MADLKWTVALLDKVSKPAREMSKTLGGFQGAIRRADKSLSTLAGGRVAKVGDKVMKGIGGAFKYAGAAALGFGAAAAAAIATAGVGLAAFVTSEAIEGENLDLALKTLLGDAKKFDDATAQIQGLSNFWGADPDHIQKQMIQLVSKGHDVADAMKIIQGSADLAALGNDANALVDAFTMLDEKGKLSAKAVERLLGAGLDPKKFRATLGDAIGADTGDLQQDIERAIKAGTLDAAALQAAALQTITKTTGKALGGLAEEQGHTIGGLLDNLKSVPARLYDAADASGAIEPMRKALESLTTALNPNSATGQKLVAALTRISAAVGKVITKITGDGEDIADWVTTLADGIEIAGDVIEVVSDLVSGFVAEFKTGFEAILGPMGKFGGEGIQMQDVVKALAATFKFHGAAVGITLGLVIQAASWIVQALVALVDGYKAAANATSAFLKGLVSGVVDFFKWLGELPFAAVEWGKAIVDGLWDGIKNGWTKVVDGVKGLASDITKTVKGALGIASPSKVMLGLGGFTAEGFALGVEKGAPRVQGAFTDLVVPPAPASAAGSGPSRGGGIVFGDTNIEITVRGSVSPEVADDLADRVRAELVKFHEQLALEMGAAA
jgi:hypothetical protein